MALKIGEQLQIGGTDGKRLLFGDFNRDLRTIGLGKPGLVFKARGHGAVANLMRMAEFVEFEQFGRQRFAAGMALTLILIDVNPEFSGHLTRFL